jgi:hypothetical protein
MMMDNVRFWVTSKVTLNRLVLMSLNEERQTMIGIDIVKYLEKGIAIYLEGQVSSMPLFNLPILTS